MTAVRAMALALIAVGAVLLWYGNTEKKSWDNQVVELVTGENKRDVTVFWVTGGGAVAIGVLGLLLGGKKR